MNNIHEILGERSKTHGDFSYNARVSQKLKYVIKGNKRSALTDVQAEALEVICAKIARIIVGNPNEIDHWMDISGYATLVANDISICNAKGNVPNVSCSAPGSNDKF